MKIQMKTYDGDEGMLLGEVDWPVLPPVGTNVRLDGLVSRKNAHLKDPPQEEILFIVHRVLFIDDVKDSNSLKIEVWLAFPPEAGVWEGAVQNDED